MDSIPQTRESASPQAGVEGAVTYRLTGPATQGIPGTQDQAAPGRPGPPLEPPPPHDPRVNPKWPATLKASVRALLARVAAVKAASPHPADLGALGEPVPAGAKRPILDDSASTAEALAGFQASTGPAQDSVYATPSAVEGLGAAGQLALTAVGTPIGPAQGALDRTWLVVLAPEPPEVPEVAPAPPVQQLTLTLPEPWHRHEPQLDLFRATFKYPSCTCPKRGHRKGCEAQVRMTTARFIEALAACWAYVVACLEAHRAPQEVVGYAARRAREVAVCCTQWKAMKCKACAHTFNYATTTPCHSRTCPVCGRKWSRKAMRAMFEYQKGRPVAHDNGVLSRDYYMHTFTEQKPEVLTLRGLRASVYNVKKKIKDVWEEVVCNLPREQGWLDPEHYAAEKLRLHAAEQAAAELPCHERAAERRRLKAERKALWQANRKKYPGKCKDAGLVGQVDLGVLGNVHAHALRYGAYHDSDDIREAAGGTWTRDIAVRPEVRKGKLETDEDALKHAVCEVLKYVCKTSTNPGTRGFVHPMLAVLFELATGPDPSGTHVRMREGYGTMRGLIAAIDAKKDDEDEAPKKCPKCGCAEHEDVLESFDRPTMPRDGWCLRPTMWKPPPGG